MDGTRFDDLIKGLCTKRLTRLSALRGLVAGAAAAVAGVALFSEETDAKKSRASAESKKHKRKQICHCVDEFATSCTTIKPRKKAAKKHLKHPCDYAGPCVAGKSGCPRTAVSGGGGGGPLPVICNAETCPDGFCVDDNCVECRDSGDCCPPESLDCDLVCVNGSCVPEVGCDVDTDCAANQICENNICVDEECGNNSHCPVGKICVKTNGDHGRCEFKDGCKIDTDCNNDQICEDDVCVAQQCEEDIDCKGLNEVCLETENNSHGRCEATACKVDTDCPNAKICVNDVCVPQQCEEDEDCKKDEICVETNNSHGRCEPVEGCKNDEECAANEICEDYVCVPQQCETDQDCAKDEVCAEIDNEHGRCVVDDQCKYDRDCEKGKECDKGECKNICSGKDPQFCPGKDDNDRDKCCSADEVCGFESDGDATCTSVCFENKKCQGNTKLCKRVGSNHYNQCVACPACLNS